MWECIPAKPSGKNSYHLLSDYCMPGTVLSPLQRLSHESVSILRESTITIRTQRWANCPGPGARLAEAPSRTQKAVGSTPSQDLHLGLQVPGTYWKQSTNVSLSHRFSLSLFLSLSINKHILGLGFKKIKDEETEFREIKGLAQGRIYPANHAYIQVSLCVFSFLTCDT